MKKNNYLCRLFEKANFLPEYEAITKTFPGMEFEFVAEIYSTREIQKKPKIEIVLNVALSGIHLSPFILIPVTPAKNLNQLK